MARRGHGKSQIMMKQKRWLRWGRRHYETELKMSRAWGVGVFRKKPRHNGTCTAKNSHMKNSWRILVAEYLEDCPWTPKAKASKNPYILSVPDPYFSFYHGSFLVLLSQGVLLSLDLCTLKSFFPELLIFPFSLTSLCLPLPLWPALIHSASLTQDFFSSRSLSDSLLFFFLFFLLNHGSLPRLVSIFCPCPSFL